MVQRDHAESICGLDPAGGPNPADGAARRNPIWPCEGDNPALNWPWGGSWRDMAWPGPNSALQSVGIWQQRGVAVLLATTLPTANFPIHREVHRPDAITPQVESGLWARRWAPQKEDVYRFKIIKWNLHVNWTMYICCIKYITKSVSNITFSLFIIQFIELWILQT